MPPMGVYENVPIKRGRSAGYLIFHDIYPAFSGFYPQAGRVIHSFNHFIHMFKQQMGMT
jgi:hypothetical protein